MKTIIAVLAATLLLASPAAAATPQTPFEARAALGELNPAWTTVSEESAYLADLDAGRVNVSVLKVATSTQGRALRVVKVNLPTAYTDVRPLDVTLVTCLQHGNEPAGREACLSEVRELADRGVRALVMPDLNPDGFVAATRYNAQGLDVNRDHDALATPEARAIAYVMDRYDPELVVDLHETARTGSQIQFDAPTYAYGSAENQARSGSRNEAARAAASAAGYTTSTYSIDPIVRGGLRDASLIGRNAAYVLQETRGNGLQAKVTRWKAHLAALDGIVG